MTMHASGEATSCLLVSSYNTKTISYKSTHYKLKHQFVSKVDSMMKSQPHVVNRGTSAYQDLRGVTIVWGDQRLP